MGTQGSLQRFLRGTGGGSTYSLLDERCRSLDAPPVPLAAVEALRENSPLHLKRIPCVCTHDANTTAVPRSQLASRSASTTLCCGSPSNEKMGCLHQFTPALERLLIAAFHSGQEALPASPGWARPPFSPRRSASVRPGTPVSYGGPARPLPRRSARCAPPTTAGVDGLGEREADQVGEGSLGSIGPRLGSAGCQRCRHARCISSRGSRYGTTRLLPATRGAVRDPVRRGGTSHREVRVWMREKSAIRSPSRAPTGSVIKRHPTGLSGIRTFVRQSCCSLDGQVSGTACR
jgi:hypothetical protein